LPGFLFTCRFAGFRNENRFFAGIRNVSCGFGQLAKSTPDPIISSG